MSEKKSIEYSLYLTRDTREFIQFEPGCLAPWPRHVPFGQPPMSEGGFYFTNWTTNILD